MIMKKTLKLLAMALMAGAMFTACGGDDKGDEPGPGPGPGDVIPGVSVDNMLSGSVKAGFAGAIEIMGSGFDPAQDWVYVGYEKDGKTEYVRITDDVLTIKSGRITFGVSINAPFLDKTFKVYLDRETTKMALTKDLTFTMPTVAEGYIPDPYFRATLMSTHPQQGNAEIAPLFDAYGLIDVAGAAKIETINLYASGATSLEGIELFTHCKRIIAHETSSLVKADFSKLKTDQYLFVTMERSRALEEVIAGPTISRLDIYNCEKLKTVDLHLNKWMHNLQCFSDPAIETFDIRREHTGTFKDKEKEPAEYCDGDNQYTVFESGAVMQLPDNVHILVDYAFITEKRQAGDNGSFKGVYNAWTRGATIDVYSSKDISKKLGTVPMYKDDAGALTLTGANGWVPAETE